MTDNLPKTFENILLLSPGVWNGVEYTSDEIKKSFELTEWVETKSAYLYLDHQDTKGRGVETWAGFIKNQRLVEDNGQFQLRGDLEVWHPWVALYLDKAKAKFGVSATLMGFENSEENQMQNFHYESFSVIIDPACKPALINLMSQQGEEKGKKLVTVNSSLIQLKGGQNNMPKEEKKLEEVAEESPAQEAAPADAPAAKKAAAEPEAEESSEDLSQDYLKALSDKLDKLISLLSKEKEAVIVEENSSEGLDEVKKSLQSLQNEVEDLNQPQRKTLSDSIGTDVGEKSSIPGMLNYLRSF